VGSVAPVVSTLLLWGLGFILENFEILTCITLYVSAFCNASYALLNYKNKQVVWQAEGV
jgi:hypothetical protein